MPSKKSSKKGLAQGTRDLKNQSIQEEVITFFKEFEDVAKAAKRKYREDLERGIEDTSEFQKLADQVESRLDDSYTLVDPFGKVWNKEQLCGGIVSGENLVELHERREHMVNIHDNMAVYVSLVSMRGVQQDTDITGDYRETHILQRDRKGWKLIGAHMNRVSQVGSVDNG